MNMKEDLAAAFAGVQAAFGVIQDQDVWFWLAWFTMCCFSILTYWVNKNRLASWTNGDTSLQ
jgi:hypothetical protein